MTEDNTFNILYLVGIVLFVVMVIMCTLQIVAWDHSTTTITVKDKIPLDDYLYVVTTENQTYTVVHMSDYANMESGKSYLVEIAYNKYIDAVDGGQKNIDGIVREV